MKKKIFTILIATLMVFALMPMTAGTAYAASEPITIDGVTYTVNEEDQTASVTGHADNYPANITIPGTIKIAEMI